MLNRRDLLRSGGLAALGLILPPFVGPEFLARKLMAGTGGTGMKKMIFIFQRGGNDAINTVIPRGDADYSSANRPGLFINDTEAVDLGNGFAQLHPSLQPLMEVFNKPNADDSCEKRDAPSVTPQVFTLLNSEVMTNRSIAMALRLQRDAETPLGQIKRVYHIVFTRQPTEDEAQALLEHYNEMVGYHQEQKAEEVIYPTELTRSMVEEFSGEPFQFKEMLDSIDKDIKDTKPSTLLIVFTLGVLVGRL